MILSNEPDRIEQFCRNALLSETVMDPNSIDPNLGGLDLLRNHHRRCLLVDAAQATGAIDLLDKNAANYLFLMHIHKQLHKK